MSGALPQFRTGKLCYVELPAHDADRSAAFYERIFGWAIRRRADGSVAFDDTAGQVSGTFVTELAPAGEPGPLIYVMVADGPASAAAVQAGGGTIVRPIDPVAEETFFWFADPAGNVLGVYQQPGLAATERAAAEAAAAVRSPYRLARSEGPVHNLGIDFTVKASELTSGAGAAVAEYITRKGEEPPDHVHPAEDEMFYILHGDVAFRCGGQTFHAGAGSFVFLPQGIEHGYDIRSDGDVRLLVVTAPPRAAAGGWGGFLADVERGGA
jgi:uncharacterized protein